MKPLSRVRAYARLIRLHQPVGNFLLLWPTLWALCIAARGHPSFKLVLIFLSGTFLMRALGCIANDIADRKFDGLVSRTKTRPLATGEISLKEAIILLVILASAAAILVFQLNGLTIKLSLIGLSLALFYPYAKRFTYWPQGILGLAFSWGVPMAFAAQTQRVPFIAWILFVSASLWPLAYDTIYAMMDREEDKTIGVKSTALLLAHYEILFIAIIYVSFIALLFILGFLLHLSFSYYLLVGLAIGLLLYQIYLIRSRRSDDCFKAFLSNIGVGAFIFLGFFWVFPMDNTYADEAEH